MVTAHFTVQQMTQDLLLSIIKSVKVHHVIMYHISTYYTY